MVRHWLPTISFLIDRLSIVTLKSIKDPELKEMYEKEANLIVMDLENLLGKGKGKMIRAIQVNSIVNELIWANESFVRKEKVNMPVEDVARRLTLTHSMNSVRNHAQNVICNITKERKDMKLDYMDPKETKKSGYDFGGIF